VLPTTAPYDIPDRTGGGCIEDGPFAGLLSNMGPSKNIWYNPHCVRRDFSSDKLTNLSGTASVEEQMAQPDYGWFEKTTEPTVHAGGHLGIGGLYGTMSDVFASRKPYSFPPACAIAHY
jgi:tyrosinase